MVRDGSCLWDFLGSGAEKEAASVSGVCAGVEVEKNEGDEARGQQGRSGVPGWGD